MVSHFKEKINTGKGEKTLFFYNFVNIWYHRFFIIIFAAVFLSTYFVLIFVYPLLLPLRYFIIYIINTLLYFFIIIYYICITVLEKWPILHIQLLYVGTVKVKASLNYFCAMSSEFFFAVRNVNF